MLKDSCAFIGIGQCGGNIVKQLDLKGGYSCFYINSSTEDLDTLDVEYDKQYHISETQGMDKDRSFAKAFIEDNERDYIIAEKIYKRYANAKIYTFSFSTSGGTGGGMSPSIIRKMKELYPDKVVNALVVKPHTSEDMIMQFNSFKCLGELHEMMKEGIINNIQIIDNNKKEYKGKLKINSEVASLLDGIMSFDGISAEGNLDAQELENMYAVKGVSFMCEFAGTDFLNDLIKAEEKIIFANHIKDATVHGLILNKEFNTEDNLTLIKETFGYPLKTNSTTWEYESNIIFIAGTSFNEQILVDLKNSYAELKKKREQVNEKVKEVDTDIDIDFSDISKASAGVNTNVKRPERRRRTGINGEMSRFRK